MSCKKRAERTKVCAVLINSNILLLSLIIYALPALKPPFTSCSEEGKCLFLVIKFIAQTVLKKNAFDIKCIVEKVIEQSDKSRI